MQVANPQISEVLRIDASVVLTIQEEETKDVDLSKATQCCIHGGELLHPWFARSNHESEAIEVLTGQRRMIRLSMY
jgi:hypothetical protein